MISIMPPLWRWAAIAGAVVMALGFAWHKGAEHEKNKQAATAFIAMQDAAKQTAVWQKAKDDALQLEKIRADKNQALAVIAGVESDRLRDKLTAYRRDLPKLSRDAVDRYAATLTDVFGNCQQEYKDLAGAADRIASDKQTLITSWPN